MENKEIMTNEEIVEVTEVAEECATNGSKGLKVAAGIGLAVLVGFGIYKIGKRISAKIKERKEQEADDGYLYLDDSDVENEDVENVD